MDREETPAERFRHTLELFELAVRMLRQRVRRERPEVTDEEVEAEVRRWLGERPGAEHGDAEGEPGTWPRR